MGTPRPPGCYTPDAHIGFQGRGIGGWCILTASHSTRPHRSPTVQVNIKHLIDDVQCYQTVRELRWPDGVVCPSCESTYVIKRGFDDTEPARQRYECHDCNKRFDDLTDTIFAGHHQPLKVWVLCLYLPCCVLVNTKRTLISPQPVVAWQTKRRRGLRPSARVGVVRAHRGSTPA